MTNVNQPLIKPGEIIPAFSLPGADGMPHSPWDYKQRQHLVLLFTRITSSNETRGLLRTFATVYPALREEQCSILAISPDTVIANLHTQEELHLPYPLLADPKREIISRYTRWDTITGSLNPSIVLADRYNTLYQQWIADSEADLPPIEELLEALRYLNKLCTP
ncbi:MAG TPA: redoxin domain-containing protein [Ktedonobacteraceae bacterium]